MVSLCALGILSAAVEESRAAWNNVFQPTLFCRKKPATTSNYVAPAVVFSSPVVAAPVVVAASPACSTCNAPPPQPSCNTSYTQRCFYQPVTTFETKTYYEPVTTMQTSYYYEPVTSYRISNYVDPCSSCVKQVATPETSYQLRAQSSPVQSWVQRCAQVPVTSYQKSCYWQPQTTCCQTTVGALIPAGAPVMAQPVQPPSITTVPAPSGPPSINEQRDPNTIDKSYYPQQFQQKSSGVPNASWQPTLGVPTFPTTSPTPPPPPVKLDRIVLGPDATVEGQVVRSDNSPKPNAKIIFVSSNQSMIPQTVTANSAGRFQASLAGGSWNVYLHGADGNPTFYTRIDVNDAQSRGITLVNNR